MASESKIPLAKTGFFLLDFGKLATISLKPWLLSAILIFIKVTCNNYEIVVTQSSLLGPVPWDPNPAPISSQSESAPKEGIAVIERSTGRVIAGVAAPSQEEIVFWLQDHPTFEVLRPSGLFY